MPHWVVVARSHVQFTSALHSSSTLFKSFTDIFLTKQLNFISAYSGR